MSTLDRIEAGVATMISAQDLRRSFGEVEAVAGLSLTVAAGEIYGLVGPDGAGKTTTFRLLCGALRMDSGSVTIAGLDLHKHLDQARERIGYLSQRFSLYEDLTVLENLRFFAEVRGLPPADWRPRSREILEFVGLWEFGARLAGQLSGGMKQKLGLAIALVTRPSILLLDEPTTGVDPLTRQDFWQLIIRLAAEEHIAVLVSTPYMDEASRCHRVGFIRGGKLVVEGQPRNLRELLAGRIVELAGSPLDRLAAVARADRRVRWVQRFGERLHLLVEPGQGQAVLAELPEALRREGVVFTRLNPVAPQLEDVFIALSEGAL
ncbi:MAG: ABC transporter ATP-binding protein [Anaerolineaceae bacterium]|nr:ABC transporter ATP-binding protein [Anaerolineaceae bacterium]